MTQSFESEALPIGGPFTILECAPPIGGASDLKSCITLPSPTTVDRFKSIGCALVAGSEFQPRSLGRRQQPYQGIPLRLTFLQIGVHQLQ